MSIDTVLIEWRVLGLVNDRSRASNFRLKPHIDRRELHPIRSSQAIASR
jgi:hypothetical protein